MLVKNLLRQAGRGPIQTVEARVPVSVGVKIFSESRFRSLPVLDKGALVGMVTIRDLLSFIANRGAAGLEAPISEAMTRNPITISATDDVEKALHLLNGRFNHLPVVEGTKLVGLLTPADVLSERLHEVRALAGDLERYIMGH